MASGTQYKTRLRVALKPMGRGCKYFSVNGLFDSDKQSEGRSYGIETTFRMGRPGGLEAFSRENLLPESEVRFFKE
jgi:hypothetical protein